jgi:hypothetical protein
MKKRKERVFEVLTTRPPQGRERKPRETLYEIQAGSEEEAYEYVKELLKLKAKYGEAKVVEKLRLLGTEVRL